MNNAVSSTSTVSADSGPGPEGRAPLPVPIPDHQLVRCIGRGSYGEVWLARNSIGTFRAAKVLRRQSFVDQRPFERELSGIRAFEPISRSHDGFVDILQVGINEEEGYFYYVMELGDDQELPQVQPERYVARTLARELSRRGKLPVRECIQLGLGLSDALACLHQHGLVHRDVKPSNIIFVGGIPKLADIGLVRAVDDARSYVGTEGFIPPEGPGTPQADIYSLGKLLYEACTGKDRQEFPNLPPGFDQAGGGKEFLEINEVILHACQHDIRRRYRSAAHLHADLLLLASGKSVRRLRLLERRFARLKRAAVLGLAGATLGALLLFPFYDHWRERAASRQRQIGAHLAYGNRTVESGDLAGALPYFANALQLDRGNPARETEHRLRLGATLAQAPKLLQMWFATQQVDEVEFSHDATKVLIVESYGRAQVFNATTGEALSPPFGQKTFFWRGSLNPSADQAVLGGEDHTARVWRLNDGSEILQLEHPDRVYSARFSPDGRHIVTGCEDKLGRVWDARNGKLEFVLPGHQDALLFAAFSPDGRTIVTTGKDFTARLWDATDGRSLGPPLRHSSWVYYAAFGTRSELVTAGFDRHAQLWNLQTFQEILPRLPHPDGVKSAEFSPDGRLILTACLDGTARIWNRNTHLLWDTVPVLHHGSRLTHARFSPDGARVLAAGIDGTVRIWDLAEAVLLRETFRGNFSADKSRYVVRGENRFQVRDSFSRQPISPTVPPLLGSADALLNDQGTFLLVCATNPASAQLWECQSSRSLGSPLRLTNSVRGFAVNPDRHSVFVAGPYGVNAWRIADGALLWSQRPDQPLASGVILNHRGTIAAAWTPKEAHFWDVSTGRERFDPIQHNCPIKHLEFSPNDKWFVSCDADAGFTACSAQVRDALSGRTVGAPLRHSDGVVRAAFSPDNSRVVTASEDFTARIWDAASGQPLGSPMRHRGQVLDAAFSPDGSRIVTAAADGSARVWSGQTGDPLTPPFPHFNPVTAATFLNNGKAIFTVDTGGEARVFRLPFDARAADDLVAIARLLSGDLIAPFASDLDSKEPLALAWQRLRARYPLTFAASSGKMAAWHQAQAEESEREGQWGAVVYHLQRLAALRPLNDSLEQRLERAQQRSPQE